MTQQRKRGKATPVRRATKARSTTSRRTTRAASETELIPREAVLEYLATQAAQMAAPDVAQLVAEREVIRGKVSSLSGPYLDLFRSQVVDALRCLEDYTAGRCPQIPYHTISVLTAALFYFLNPMDAVPDDLPHLGALDDALVMAVATEMAAPGLTRYHDWKSDI